MIGIRLGRIAAHVLVGLALSGCASDMSHQNLYDQIPGLWHAITRPGQLPAAPQTQVSSQIKSLHMTLPDQNWSATFIPVTRRDGAVTWQTGSTDAPRATLTIRNGVVIATRGLGDDLMASDTADLTRAKSGAKSATGQRTNRYLRGNGDLQSTIFICDYSRTTEQFIERCTGARTSITNTYGTSQSRQWLGPTLGYVELTFTDP